MTLPPVVTAEVVNLAAIEMTTLDASEVAKWQSDSGPAFGDICRIVGPSPEDSMALGFLLGLAWMRLLKNQKHAIAAETLNQGGNKPS